MRIVLFTKILTLGRLAGLALELAGRGDEVVVAAPSRERREPDVDLRSAGIRLERYDEFEDEAFGQAANLLRRTRDYAWYLRPEHDVGTFNRRRALHRLVKAASGGARGGDERWPDPLLALDPAVSRGVEEMLAGLELALPPDPGVVRFLAGLQPDAVLVTPLIRPGLHQTEVVKAARVLGVPSAFPVYSWDSLSNKGLMHALPDRVYAWNDVHRREAIELHGIDPARAVVTGAPHWDSFFALAPAQGRSELCARHAFDPGRPIVLYLGSTRTVCRDEPPIVERWLAALRHGPALVREANVLVRPHPGERDAPRWAGWAPPAPRVSISDPAGKADQTLFDELHHATAVVGLNTSAQIEAAILGKPVYTFAAGGAALGQEGTLHFHHLLREHGGVVSYADTLEEHVLQLERGVAGDHDVEATRRLCRRLVRPRSLDRPVVPILADEVTELATSVRPGRVGAPAGQLG